MHVQHHFAFEDQRAVDLRVRADHDARRLALARVEPALARLFDVDAAVHVRARADGHVAVDRLDAAAEVAVDQADRAVHRHDVVADLAAAVDVDAAVDGLDAVVDLRLGADADAAVDRGERAHADVVAGVDAAVDRLGLVRAGVVLDADAPVHRGEVAVGPAGLGGDAAVDLVDAVLGEGGQGRRGEQKAQGEGDAGARHGGNSWNGPVWMRRTRVRFNPLRYNPPLSFAMV